MPELFIPQIFQGLGAVTEWYPSRFSKLKGWNCLSLQVFQSSGAGIVYPSVVDPDPVGSGTFCHIRIRAKPLLHESTQYRKAGK
jgi:hypothetical protein